MFKLDRPARTVVELQPVVKELFQSIDRSPGGYSELTNPLVDPIYQSWQTIQSGLEVDPELCQSLESPQTLTAKMAPSPTVHTPIQLVAGLGKKVGIYMGTAHYDYGIREVHRTGRNAGKSRPEGDDWEQVRSDESVEVYHHRRVIEELKEDPRADISNTGFHHSSSAILPRIARWNGLVSSQTILDAGEQLVSGEVQGRNRGHENVFVYTSHIAGYGMPKWFDQFTLVVGIDLDKQRQTLAATGREFLTSESDGTEVGPRVPMENINLLSCNAVHLPKLRQWAQDNCPDVPVISREVLKLKYGK